MTKEELETIKECLKEYSEMVTESCNGVGYYNCCLSRAKNGHYEHCLTIQSIRLLEKEIKVVDFKEKSIEFYMKNDCRIPNDD
jgi:hypothetical protein